MRNHAPNQVVLKALNYKPHTYKPLLKKRTCLPAAIGATLTISSCFNRYVLSIPSASIKLQSDTIHYHVVK